MKRFLALTIVFLMVFGMVGGVLAVEPVVSVELMSNSPSPTGDVLSLYLKNTGDVEVLITGPIDVHILNGVEGVETLSPEETNYDFVDGLVIQPGTDMTIATIQSGAPGTWKDFSVEKALVLGVTIMVNGDSTRTNNITHQIEAEEPKEPERNFEMISNSPTDQMDPITFSFINKGGEGVTITDVQVMLEGGPESLMAEEYLYEGSVTVESGQTVAILQVAPGNPESWRGFYGEGPHNFYFLVTVDGEPWESNEISHAVIVPEQDPNAVWGFTDFVRNNYDGTISVSFYEIENTEGLVQGLGIADFTFEVHNPDRFEDIGPENVLIGTVVSVTEVGPGAYLVIWEHDDGEYVLDCLIGESLLGWGMPVKVSNLDLPEDFGDIESNLLELENLEETEEDLIFTKPGFGSIIFGSGLNIADNAEQLHMLADSLNVYYNEDTNSMVASVNTAALTFLADHAATIVFADVSVKLGISDLTVLNFRTYLNIWVYDNDGVLQADVSEFFDWENVVYDEMEDALYLPVNHFTDYVLGVLSETDDPVGDDPTSEDPTGEDPAGDDEGELTLPETGGSWAALLLGIMLIGLGLVLKRRVLA